jgi:hypothetical protein
MMKSAQLQRALYECSLWFQLDSCWFENYETLIGIVNRIVFDDKKE